MSTREPLLAPLRSPLAARHVMAPLADVAAPTGGAPEGDLAGEPLPALARASMEPRFGHDFSRVRVHTDGRAAASVQSTGARAYTVGNHVMFGPGQFEPSTPKGRHLLAHELAHVVQQDAPRGAGGGDAEGRARSAAWQVSRGESVPPGALGGAPVGMAADDGRDPGPPAGTSPKLGGAPLVGPLNISAQIVEALRSKGLLSPELVQMIASGQVVVEPDKGTAMAGGGFSPTATGDFAKELNRVPSRFSTFGGSGAGPTAGFGSSVAAPLPKSFVVGGFTDPLLGYVPPHVVTLAPSGDGAKDTQPGPPNLLQRILAGVKTDFSWADGVTVSSVSHPALATSIHVTGITQSLFKTKAGLAGQVEASPLGKSVGFQLSYQSWYLHGDVDTDGKWNLTVSFPSDAPIPVLPWLQDIMSEGAVAVKGFVDVAAEGPPDLNNRDSLGKRVGPHVDRIKNAIDAGKGMYKAQPGVNVGVMIGSGPRPGVTPAEKPSGIYIGGSLKVSF